LEAENGSDVPTVASAGLGALSHIDHIWSSDREYDCSIPNLAFRREEPTTRVHLAENAGLRGIYSGAKAKN
jgi:hypothetical protein